MRLALRSVAKQPGFALITVLTLALGIGATSAVFSLIQGVLLTPPPYRQPERLVLIESARADGQKTNNGRNWAALQWQGWQQEAKSFEAIAAYNWSFNYLVLPDGSESLEGMFVTPEYFKTMGLQPILGRTFVEAETGGGPVFPPCQRDWKEAMALWQAGLPSGDYRRGYEQPNRGSYTSGLARDLSFPVAGERVFEDARRPHGCGPAFNHRSGPTSTLLRRSNCRSRRREDDGPDSRRFPGIPHIRDATLSRIFGGGECADTDRNLWCALAVGGVPSARNRHSKRGWRRAARHSEFNFRGWISIDRRRSDLGSRRRADFVACAAIVSV